MTKINLGEMNELALFVQNEQYKECIDQGMRRNHEENKELNSNDVAKREIATELIQQGFSEEAICRILNISPGQLPETLP